MTFDAHLTPPRSRPAAPRPRPRQRRRQPRAHPVLLVYSLLPSDIPRDNLSRLNRSSGRFSVLYSLAHGRLLLEPLPIPLPRQLQRRKFHHDDNDDSDAVRARVVVTAGPLVRMCSCWIRRLDRVQKRRVEARTAVKTRYRCHRWLCVVRISLMMDLGRVGMKTAQTMTRTTGCDECRCLERKNRFRRWRPLPGRLQDQHLLWRL